MLDKLRMNDARKPSSTDNKLNAQSLEQYTSGSEVCKTSVKKEMDVNTESDVSSARDLDRFSISDMFTPATEVFDESVKAANEEMERVKRELEAAKSVINQQKRELEETRNFKHTMEQALPSPSEADFDRGIDSQIASMHRLVSKLFTKHQANALTVFSMHLLDLSTLSIGLLVVTTQATLLMPLVDNSELNLPNPISCRTKDSKCREILVTS